MYEKFVELLNKNNITAYAVSKAIGISPTVFSDWKSGKSKPKVDKLLSIANYFDVELEFFLKENVRKDEFNETNICS